MIDYHKYVGYCRSDEKREKPVGGAGGRWDEEKPVENKPVENKPVESGGTIQPIRPLGVEIPNAANRYGCIFNKPCHQLHMLRQSFSYSHAFSF